MVMSPDDLVKVLGAVATLVYALTGAGRVAASWRTKSARTSNTAEPSDE